MTTVDLTIQDSCTFNSEPGDNPERFRMFFSNHTGIGEIQPESAPMICYSGGKIKVISPSQFDGTTLLFELFDLTGRCLMNKQIEPQGEIAIDHDIVSGIYITRLYVKEKGQYYPAI